MHTGANTDVVASLRVKEGNLGGTGTATTAATVYIDDAPTEGTNNYALYAGGATAISTTLSVQHYLIP